MKYNSFIKFTKGIFCFFCILTVLTGCSTRHYSMPSISLSAEEEQAIQEEEDAVNNPPIANCTSDEVVQVLKDNNIELDVEDTQNGKIINSKNEFYCIELYDSDSNGKKGVSTVYITINSKNPLKNDDLWTELTGALNVLFTEVCGTYDEQKIIDSLQALNDNTSSNAIEHLDYDSRNQVVISYIEKGTIIKKKKIFMNLILCEN